MQQRPKICGVEISVVLNTQSHGVLSFNWQEAKSKLETLILDNYCENTGFLLWFPSCCITCIFRQTARAKYMFSSLVEAIANITQNKFKTEHVHYKIQFLSCTYGVDSVKGRNSWRNIERTIHMTVWSL